MLTYAVAIRTLALAPDTLRRVLEGVYAQSVAPQSVTLYIADGHEPPSWRVAGERYVTVPQGMMRQRLLDYPDLDTDCLLMLDDDLLLAGPDTMRRLLEGMEQGGYDLLGADMFRSHLLPLRAKIRGAVTGLAFPHRHRGRGFVMRPSGSFSYPAAPEPRILPSDTCGGPLMLWRLDAYRRLRLRDELWMECEEFVYGDDALITYKATVNGLRTGVDFGAEVTNLDSRTSSDRYRRDPRRHYIRARLMTMAWWRMLYRPDGRPSVRALVHGIGKMVWTAGVLAATSVATLSAAPLLSGIRGWRDGLREAPRSAPPYRLTDPSV